jgi:hypothetical protein
MKVEIKYSQEGIESEINQKVKELIGRAPKTVFSIFKTKQWPTSEKGDIWYVEYPDIFSTDPVVEGDVNLVYNGWETDSIVKYTNPTWKDIILFFENAADGHHIFLEGLYRDGNDIQIVAGS